MCNNAQFSRLEIDTKKKNFILIKIYTFQKGLFRSKLSGIRFLRAKAIFVTHSRAE